MNIKDTLSQTDILLHDAKRPTAVFQRKVWEQE